MFERWKRWKPTHYSLHDGSTARLVAPPRGAVVILENESGDRWEDDYADWAVIPEDGDTSV